VASTTEVSTSPPWSASWASNVPSTDSRSDATRMSSPASSGGPQIACDRDLAYELAYSRPLF
jgi:hypothetical protein